MTFKLGKSLLFRKTVVATLFVLGLSVQVSALDLTKVNLKYLYDPYSAVRIQHKAVSEDGQSTFYFKLNLVNPLRPENDFAISFHAQKGYKDKSEQPLEPVLIRQDSVSNLILLKYQLSVDTKYDLIVGSFLINNVYYYYDIPINSSLKFPCTDVLPLKENGWPYFDNFIKEGTILNLPSPVVTYQYRDQFGIAKPPMSFSTDPSGQVLKIDSVFEASAFTLNNERVLSFIQKDSTSMAGCSYLTVGPYYPKLRRIDDLSETIIYISKKEEHDAVLLASERKKAFDKFWLNLLQTKDRAGSVLKRYFRNVMYANTFFTDYKEGWRTDRGMVFIIYGIPSEVIRSEEEEIWSYTISGKKQNFTFAKVPNLFVQHHYVLVRNSGLSRVWLNEVGKWRKGNI